MVTNRVRSVKNSTNNNAAKGTNDGDKQPWHVGIEALSSQDDAVTQLEMYEGALATSGDARRFLIKDGIRYGHVLNPKTGWPVEGAPRSVTVAQATCTQAGILSTLAMLQGSAAENFLIEQEAKYWVLR